MANVHLHSWNVKPMRWGSDKDVQAALFHNAEQMGIDPESIALAMPMFNPGDQRDYSKHGLIGTNSGAVFKQNSLSFDAEDDYIAFSDNNQFEGLGEYTVFATVRRTGTLYTGASRVLNKVGGVLAFGFEPTNMSVWQGGWKDRPYTMPINTDIQAAISFDGTDIHYYIDGIRLGSIAATTTGTGAGGLFIGNLRASSSAFWPGNIKQFLSTNQYSTPTQIATLSDNPYQLWQPYIAPVYFDQAVTPVSTILPIIMNYNQKMRS